MNFFKKLFSKGNTTELPQEIVEEAKQTPENETQEEVEIITQKYFDDRYTKEDIKDYNKVLDGGLKLIESFFLDLKLKMPVESPINHPKNIDEAFDNIISFKMYCNGFGIENNEIVMILSITFSDFLVQKYGFELYKDNSPEYPLRSKTLKYNKDEVVVSLYPFEYSEKVLNMEATFEDLENQIKDKLEILPQYLEKIN